MTCNEWQDLVTRYRMAVRAYNAAADRLGLTVNAGFNAAWQQAESARKNTDRARAALLHHEHDHACLAGHLPGDRHQIQDLTTEELILGDQGQSGG